MKANTRRAIVTGGNSGIGRATVLRLARNGWDVGFTYRSHRDEAAKTADLARRQGNVVHFRQADFSKPEAARNGIRDMIHELKGLQLLVNNAATNPRATFLGLTSDQWKTTIDVNVTVPILAMQVAAEEMAANGTGCIINVTSVVAGVPQVRGSAYCASKAALRSLTQVAALEMAALGIRVIDLEPGHIATRMNYGEQSINPRNQPLPLVPMGRSGAPHEIAAMIAFLASEGASYITGSTFRVDGGLMLVAAPEALQQQMGVPPASS